MTNTEKSVPTVSFPQKTTTKQQHRPAFGQNVRNVTLEPNLSCLNTVVKWTIYAVYPQPFQQRAWEPLVHGCSTEIKSQSTVGLHCCGLCPVKCDSQTKSADCPIPSNQQHPSQALFNAHVCKSTHTFISNTHYTSCHKTKGINSGDSKHSY